MATIIKEPLITFIHIPKCGGNSVTSWMQKHCNANVTKRKQHATVNQVKRGIHSLGPIEDLGFTFCIVRNPWDYMVSWYEFKRRLCIQYIKKIEEDPKLNKPNKSKWNLDANKSRLDRLDTLGFSGWLKQAGIKPQWHWAKDCEYIMQLENINEDFKIIQEKVNSFSPLLTLNKTKIRRQDYKSYYQTQEDIDIVSKKYEKDIKIFDYTF